MIITVIPQNNTYILETGSLERPGNTISLIVKPDEQISEVVRKLNDARGTPK